MLQLFLIVISQKFHLQKGAWVGIKKMKKRRATSVSSEKKKKRKQCSPSSLKISKFPKERYIFFKERK
jgi:hypothetical protein